MPATQPVWLHIALAVGAIASPIAAYLVAMKNVSGVLKSAERQIKSAQELAAKQVRSSVVSANRQKWLDELRADIAEFVAEFVATRSKGSAQQAVAERAEQGRKIHLRYVKIQLRLNPDRPEQAAILAALDALVADVNGSNADQLLQTLTRATQSLAQSVWRQVKSGD
jgi:hypothetical protein